MDNEKGSTMIDEHEQHFDDVFSVFNAIAAQAGVHETSDLIDELTSGKQEKDLPAFMELNKHAEQAYTDTPSLHAHKYWFDCTLNASLPHTRQQECIPFIKKIQTKLKQRLN
jgi:hypothetical protein